MAANLNPIFTLIPVIGCVEISTANTNRDGTGTLGTVLTGAAEGTRVTKVTIQALGTTTAGMVRLFIDTGAAIYLWKEIPITAITGSASVAEFFYALELLGERALILPTGYILKASTHNAETFNVIAEGGNS
jgi:hypothetical protein